MTLAVVKSNLIILKSEYLYLEFDIHILYTADNIKYKKVHFIIIYSAFCSAKPSPTARFTAEQDGHIGNI